MYICILSQSSRIEIQRKALAQCSAPSCPPQTDTVQFVSDEKVLIDMFILLHSTLLRKKYSNTKNQTPETKNKRKKTHL